MSRPVKTAARWSERRPAYLRPLLPLVAISAATLVLFAARPAAGQTAGTARERNCICIELDSVRNHVIHLDSMRHRLMLHMDSVRGMRIHLDSMRRGIMLHWDSMPGAAVGSFGIAIRRGILGVMVDTDPEPRTDSLGVRIEEVAPRSPAERAGLRAGDILVAVDGKSLAAPGTPPHRRLADLIDEAEPGDSLRIDYLRDGARRSTTAVLDRRSFAGAWPLEEVRVLSGAGAPIVHTFGRPFRFRELQLVDVNPGLGTYFGTEKGVLVANVDKDSELGLRPGDVVLRIGEREVRDAAHMYSILESYRPDETVRFQLVRQRETITVEGKVR